MTSGTDITNDQYAGLRATLAEDFRGMVPGDQQNRALRIAGKLMISSSMKAIVRFRISQRLYRRGLRLPALRMQQTTLRKCGADLHPAASVGAGFKIPHPSGIVLGNNVTIGRWFTCYHGVTVGRSDDGDAMATIGDFVTVGAGAKILGDVAIGEHATVGANAVVVNDVAPNTTVGGIPARPLIGGS